MWFRSLLPMPDCRSIPYATYGDSLIVRFCPVSWAWLISLTLCPNIHVAVVVQHVHLGRRSNRDWIKFLESIQFQWPRLYKSTIRLQRKPASPAQFIPLLSSIQVLSLNDKLISDPCKQYNHIKRKSTRSSLPIAYLRWSATSRDLYTLDRTTLWVMTPSCEISMYGLPLFYSHRDVCRYEV